jgi:hypothetical protein
MIDVSNIFLPHPNPPLIKGRELDFLLSPLYKGGLRGVKITRYYFSNIFLAIHLTKLYNLS